MVRIKGDEKVHPKMLWASFGSLSWTYLFIHYLRKISLLENKKSLFWEMRAPPGWSWRGQGLRVRFLLLPLRWSLCVPWLESTGPCRTVREYILLGYGGCWAEQMGPLKQCVCEIKIVVSGNIQCTLDSVFHQCLSSRLTFPSFPLFFSSILTLLGVSAVQINHILSHRLMYLGVHFNTLHPVKMRWCLKAKTN